VFIVVYFVIDSARKLLDTPSYYGISIKVNMNYFDFPLKVRIDVTEKWSIFCSSYFSPYSSQRCGV